MRWCFLLVLWLPLTAQAYCKQFWRTGALAQTHGEKVALHSDGRVAASISRDWLRGIEIVSAKIDAASGISTALHLCDSHAPNAFAARDKGQNIIALTLGMVRLLGNDWHAYAAIIGHENAHLVRQHGAKRQRRGYSLALAQSTLNVVAGGRGSNLGGVDLVALGATAFDSSYSRAEEREADRDGMRYAHCAGFAPEGALRLHNKLNTGGNFLSSHPSSANRITALRGRIPALRNTPCP